MSDQQPKTAGALLAELISGLADGTSTKEQQDAQRAAFQKSTVDFFAANGVQCTFSGEQPDAGKAGE